MTDAAGFVPADDRGLTLGVGLFETILFVDAAPRLLPAHLDRMRRSCGVIGLPEPSAAELEDAARRAVTDAGLQSGRAAVRLTWTGGPGARGLAAPARPRPRLIAQAVPAGDPPPTLSLATASVRRNPTSPASRLKTLSYLDNVAARAEAVAAGADEALCLDTQGRLACAAAGNLFWLEGRRLCTPALACGVLPGVIRAELIARAEACGLEPCEVEAPASRLAGAEGVYVTNSLIGVVPVARIDGQTQAVRRLPDELMQIGR